ncbi:MAG: hypothetical protein RLZZ196_3071 [Bacteroidota bacterium]
MSRDIKRISVEESQFYVPLRKGDMDRAIAFALFDSKDHPGWEDVRYFGESIFDASGAIRRPEWVYVLVNKSVPGICKIGMTTISVTQRIHEINGATGVITPWFPVFEYKCVNSKYLEREVHDYLEKNGYRVNPRREGFEIDSLTAASIIERLGEKYQVPREIEE